MAEAVKCLFCKKEVPEPEQVCHGFKNCSSCQAFYWQEMASDLGDVIYDAREILEISDDEDIEINVQREFDRLTDSENQPREEGEEVCLIFARKKQGGKEKTDIFKNRDKILEKSLVIAKEKYPKASSQKLAAFANSVAYFMTGWSGGYGGPSVREHAASRIKAQKERWSFEEAVKELIKEDGIIFGSIQEIHKKMWEQECCFDDDPEDESQLSSLN